jgi:glycosyltransferase involved in cell wall biosynthesis
VRVALDGDVRLAVYSDYGYRRQGDAYYTDQAFALFVSGLADHVDKLVMVGRVDPAPGTWHYRLRDDVEIASLPHYPHLSEPIPAAVAMLRSIVRVWRTLKTVDAVWLLGPHPLSIVFAMLAALKGKRVVLGVRQDFPQYARNRHPGRTSFLLIAVALEVIYRVLAAVFPVVVVGPGLARQYRHARSLLPIFVSLVREQDIAQHTPKRDWNCEIRLLSVGRVEAEKNPLLLADVLAQLREHDERWRLEVCGEGPMLPELKRRLRELGVDEHADLKGYVPNGGLLDLYRQADAFVHVSWTEGAPGVLLEAFAAGLPVVATAVGGVAEMAEDSALLVPAGDADATSRALLQLAADRRLRTRLRESALACAREHTQEAESQRVARFIAGRDTAR